MGYSIGPRIGIEGENEFRRQLAKVTAAYKAMAAETKSVAAAFDAAGTAEGRAEEISARLNSQIDKQKEKIALLRQAVSAAAEEKGADSQITSEWRRRLAEAETELHGLEGRLRTTQEGVEDVSDAMEDASGKTLDFSDVLKANLLSDVVMSGLRKLGELAKKAASGVVEAGADLTAQEAMFEQTFSGVESSARSALRAVADESGITATRLQESYARVYAFAKTIGADSETALNIAQRALTAAADSAAYYDRTVEDATESLQSFLKGNYANDAALGIAATETTRNAKANELYAKSFKELTEAQKVDTLLSMVEAGNKASGAFGQAARESDGWLNVTGELEEAWRQLQGTLGKSVLEKITPKVKEITSRLKDLQKSGAMDDIAERAGQLLDWAIEKGPGAAKALAAVGAGLLTIKAATTAVDVAEKIKGIAGAVTALNISMSTGVIAAVGLLAGGIAAIAISAANAKDKALEAARALETATENAEANYEKSRTAAEGTAEAASAYVQRLQELEDQGLKTADAQWEYANIVDKLNALIPELNIQIDEQTGVIEGSTAAILENIEAWKQQAVVEALQKKYSDQLEAMAAATAELYENKVQYNEASRREADLARKLEDAQERLTRAAMKREEWQLKLDAARRDGLEISEEEWAANERNEQEYQALMESVTSLANEYTNAQWATQSWSDRVAAGEAAIEKFNPALELAKKALDEYTNSMGKCSEESEAMKTAASAVAEAVLKTADAVEDSVTTQIKWYDDLSGKSSKTFQEILEAVKSQRRAFDEYAENIKSAMARGIDEGLVKKLSDGSAESMQILDTLVHGTDEQIEALNDALGGVEKGKERVRRALQEVGNAAQAELEDMAAGARQAGQSLVQGLIDGMSDKTWDYVNEMKRIALAGQGAYRQTNEIKSPSRAYKRLAGMDVAGIVEAYRAGESQIAAATAALAMAGQNSYAAAEIDQAVARASESGWAITSGRENTSARVSVTLGGVQISVGAGQVQNTDELVQEISERLAEEISRRVVAYV